MYCYWKRRIPGWCWFPKVCFHEWYRFGLRSFNSIDSTMNRIIRKKLQTKPFRRDPFWMPSTADYRKWRILTSWWWHEYIRLRRWERNRNVFCYIPVKSNEVIQSRCCGKTYPSLVILDRKWFPQSNRPLVELIGTFSNGIATTTTTTTTPPPQQQQQQQQQQLKSVYIKPPADPSSFWSPNSRAVLRVRPMIADKWPASKKPLRSSRTVTTPASWNCQVSTQEVSAPLVVVWVNSFWRLNLFPHSFRIF